MNGILYPAASSPMSSALSSTLIRERAKARGEPAWLVDARVEAYETYVKLETPKWRRTDLAALQVEAFSVKASDGTPRAPPLPKQAGVLAMPLAQAAREHEALVRPLLALSPRADKWEALHAALWNAGTLVHVERGVEAAHPVVLEEPFAPTGGVVHDAIILERTGKAQLLARTIGGAQGALAHHGLALRLGDGANLSLATMQELNAGVTLLSNKRAQLARDSRLTWIDGQFGAGTSVTVNENVLAGQGSALHFIGAFFGSHGQHLDVTTSALHEAPHTDSRLDMKGALNEDGYSANYSIVNIGPTAKNSSGHQKQETLILSDRARADAIPKLDVENNEVSASHGATVGQVDPDQLFYLRARGFDELGAKRLIVEGFFEPLLREIPLEDVRDDIRRKLVGRLSR